MLFILSVIGVVAVALNEFVFVNFTFTVTPDFKLKSAVAGVMVAIFAAVAAGVGHVANQF